MIHPALTRRLRNFVGTESAQAAMSRTLPPDFSRPALLAELREIRAALPAHPLAERIFGEPEFLSAGAAAGRVAEWERSRAALVAAIRALAADGPSSSQYGPKLRYSFAHTEGVAVAVAFRAADRAAGAIGVDLERATREISDGAYAKFHTPAERGLLDRRLDHWVLKEAAFKAHSRVGETIVADYAVTAAISGGDAGAEEYRLECRRGEPEHFRGWLGTIDEFRIAMAIPTA